MLKQILLTSGLCLFSLPLSYAQFFEQDIQEKGENVYPEEDFETEMQMPQNQDDNLAMLPSEQFNDDQSYDEDESMESQNFIEEQ